MSMTDSIEETQPVTKTFRFKVDGALLRELGERLVGRHHAALSELIKNAYDADALDCEVRFVDGAIVVADNGHGMKTGDFERYWMHIGNTHQVEKRTSPELGRELTGSKGIGRLSAQFLADRITIETVAKSTPNRQLTVDVDWQAALKKADITEYEAGYREGPKTVSFPRSKPHGMKLTLHGLKHGWTSDDFQRLGYEVWMLRSPLAYLMPGRAEDDFDVLLFAENTENEEAFDGVFQSVIDDWKARISGHLEDGRENGEARITVEFAAGYGDDDPETFSERVKLPVREEGRPEPTKNLGALDRARFEVMIFKAAGRQTSGVYVQDFRSFLNNHKGVHIYDGGFRFPHYAGRDNEDWLNVITDMSRRKSASELLPEHLQESKMALDLPGSGRVFGAVEVSTRHEEEVGKLAKAEPGEILTINVSRDRLVDNEAFTQLRRLVRWSIDFYASRYRLRSLRSAERERDRATRSQKLARLREVLEEHKQVIPAASYTAIKHEITGYLKAAKADDTYRERSAALLAPLATAGMSALAMTHEFQREMGHISGIVERLNELSDERNIPELEELAKRLEEWRERTEALQELFAPFATEEDRDDGKRLRAKPLLQHVVRTMRPLLPGVEIKFGEGLASDVRLPTGSLAEWSALFQNVLSNAWNAMLDSTDSRIRLDAGTRGRRHWLSVSDTGRGLGVVPDDAEKMFAPFERALEVSADRRSLMIGGRGLGLTIVRMIAHRRNANVGFVDAAAGFSTTFELSW